MAVKSVNKEGQALRNKRSTGKNKNKSQKPKNGTPYKRTKVNGEQNDD